MICPTCHSALCRRSKRRKLLDYSLSLLGLRPWRCKTCDRRFYAWLVPVLYVGFTHCPQCGNLDLQRVSREKVDEGLLVGLRRALHFPAYRCEPCRNRFFSLRLYRRIVPTRVEPTPGMAPPGIAPGP